MSEDTNTKEEKEESKKSEVPKQFDFDLVLTRIPINLKDKEGKVHKYYLEELNGVARDAHLDDLGDRMKYDRPDGKARMSTMKEMMTNLLSACVYKVVEGGDDTLVPVEVLQQWPARITQELYDTANDISALTEKAEKNLKKG